MPDFPPEADFSDLTAVGEALSRAVPDCEPVCPLSVLGEGFYSLAVETSSGFVFRLGFTQEVVKRHDKEARLLPWLGAKLPIAIPQPRWRVTPCKSIPYGAIGYPKLGGRMLTDEDLQAPAAPLAHAFAALLLSLHQVPIAEAERLGASSEAERYQYLERVRNNVLPVLASRLDAGMYESIATWWGTFLVDQRMREYTPALIHGDLDYTNLLTDETAERLVAVLDWEHAAIGDPALDFLQLRYFGAGFQDAVIRAYISLGGHLGGDAGYRLQQYWRLGGCYGIQLALRRGSESLLAKHIERLRQRFEPN